MLRVAGRVRVSGLLSSVPFAVLNITIPVFLPVGALVVPGVAADVGVLAAGLLAALLLSLSVRPIPFFAIERLTAFVTAVTVVYYLNRDDWLHDLCPPCAPLFFGTLAVTIAVWVRFSSERFKINTQDILILLIAAAIPALPDLGLTHLGIVALESLILFYGIELLVQERDRRWDQLRVGVIVALGVLAARGLFS